MKKKTTKQILRAALKLLQEKGWTQGAFHAHGRYCALGAINKAAGGTDAEFTKSKQDAVSKLNEIVKLTYWNASIVSWNDSALRKKSDVVDAFKQAIENCE